MLLSRSSASAGMEEVHYSLESNTPCKTPVDLEEEPEDLLEKSWFFGNLLDRKSRMSRCYSDPCPCPKLSDDEEMLVGKSYEETYSSLKKLPPQVGNSTSPGLARAPSSPEESAHHTTGSIHLVKESKTRLQPSSNNLFRAPSLPISIGREEFHDEESEFSMSKLIRQASLTRPDTLPPRRLLKIVTESSSTPRNRQIRRKPDSESIRTESPEGNMTIRPHPIGKTNLRRSSSDLIDELKGFKNLSFKWDSQDLDSADAKKISGPNEDKMRKSSLYDQGWQPQNSSSPMSIRSSEDMKAQIKFWARAVASNVRQEC